MAAVVVACMVMACMVMALMIVAFMRVFDFAFHGGLEGGFNVGIGGCVFDSLCVNPMRVFQKA